MRSRKHQQIRQSGLSTFATIGAFVGLGTVFLLVFFTLGAPNKGVKTGTTTGTTAQNQAPNQATPDGSTSAGKEPPYIRIPENSAVYSSSVYNFMFAYPDSFGTLTDLSAGAVAPVLFSTESALASQKPVGNGGAVMNGKLGAYVYKKSDFKIIVQQPDVTVGPTKTGNDTTWKVVAHVGDGKDFAVGSAYPVKSVRSQTGVTVFDFGFSDPLSHSLFGRWVFEDGDNFVIIAMPTVSKPSGAALTSSDLAAYTVIGNNIARTVRVPSAN